VAGGASGRGLLRGIARAVADALIGSQRRPGSDRGRGSRGRPATLRAARRGSDAASPALGLEDSPGRNGADATRDLTPHESGALRPSYAPHPDGDPDPGEVVWTWVPYVENDGRGKDRPVLIIARIDGDTTAGCYLSTKAHRDFVSVGTGGWDSQGRESFLSPERVLRITDSGMRREGHVLPRERFAPAVQAVMRRHGIRG
jgi:hypothetical protein